jgi:hypothetical protein
MIDIGQTDWYATVDFSSMLLSTHICTITQRARTINLAAWTSLTV